MHGTGGFIITPSHFPPFTFGSFWTQFLSCLFFWMSANIISRWFCSTIKWKKNFELQKHLNAYIWHFVKGVSISWSGKSPPPPDKFGTTNTTLIDSTLFDVWNQTKHIQGVRNKKQTMTKKFLNSLYKPLPGVSRVTAWDWLINVGRLEEEIWSVQLKTWSGWTLV